MVAQRKLFQAHKPINFASSIQLIVSFYHIFKISVRNFDLECKPGKQKTALWTRKLSGTFEKRAQDEHGDENVKRAIQAN